MTRRGFTFAELILCLGIMGMALLALVSAEIYSARADRGGSQRHQATMVASSLMAEAEKDLRRDFGASVAAGRQAVPGNPGYEYELLEQSEVGGRIKRLQVNVFWSDQQGDQQYSLWTRVLEP
ncbi:MAG: hypothetical protein AMXMBFR33_11740 [Candidatus Xenobia bacterium]